jgi:cytochrome c556
MRNYSLIILFLGVFLFSCNSNKKEVKKEELVMYVPSEMTLLMRELFEFQEKSKKQIKNGELPLDFPEKFKKIHTAELSDQFEHDASFQGFSKAFLKNIEDLGNSTKANVKVNFNTAIQTCIACHKTTCDGPITRIEKLVIK